MGDDGVGIEGEFAACADSDWNIGGEGEGKERDEGERDGGVHDVDVVVLACCLWGNNECFADWLGAKSERLKEIRIENMTKGKCSLSEKECLSYKKGQKRQSCLLYRITQMLIWKLSYGP